jgi:hypothetical protein
MEDIEKQIKSYERNQKLTKAGNELAEMPAGSAAREENLEQPISLLDPDPDAQTYIRLDRCRGKIDRSDYQKIKEENDAIEPALAKQK